MASRSRDGLPPRPSQISPGAPEPRVEGSPPKRWPGQHPHAPPTGYRPADAAEETRRSHDGADAVAEWRLWSRRRCEQDERAASDASPKIPQAASSLQIPRTPRIRRARRPPRRRAKRSSRDVSGKNGCG
eukprot:scaffold650_cov249-Pinguiococcus_pyrenoidosus.AAC.10